MPKKTGFDKYVDEKMKDPEFAKGYEEAMKELIPKGAGVKKYIKLSEFSKMTEAEKEQAISELIKAAMEPPTAEELAELDAKITAYEQRYNIASDKIHESIDSGILSETAEVCSWLMLVELRKRIKG